MPALAGAEQAGNKITKSSASPNSLSGFDKTTPRWKNHRFLLYPRQDEKLRRKA
jgi:hypothetical protein